MAWPAAAVAATRGRGAADGRDAVRRGSETLVDGPPTTSMPLARLDSSEARWLRCALRECTGGAGGVVWGGAAVVLVLLSGLLVNDLEPVDMVATCGNDGVRAWHHHTLPHRAV